jgi:hypothetical protein
MENTSGQGKTGAVPEEIRGWSWGAFFLGFIWGLFNRVYSSLLVFVPVVNLVVPFVLGAKGNKWAWQNKRWDSVEHFHRVQRNWARWGLGTMVVCVVLGVALGLSEGFSQLEAAEAPVAAPPAPGRATARAEGTPSRPATIAPAAATPPTPPVAAADKPAAEERKAVAAAEMPAMVSTPAPIAASPPAAAVDNAGATASASAVRRRYPTGDLSRCLEYRSNTEVARCAENGGRAG